MAYYTFDTAWIVAHMQNSNNEAVKEAIRARLTEDRWFDDSQARLNYQNFETYCWAWQNGCLASPNQWEWYVRMPPAVNCYPYKGG